MSELWSRPVPIAGLLLALLALIAWLPRRLVRTPGVALFRCLLPSWRFFDQIDIVPTLRLRAAPHGDDWSEWQDALIAPPRTLGSLGLNAAGNLYLASRSLIEHLVADLEQADGHISDRNEPTSYRLVCALVEQRARAMQPSSPRLRYQFCLVEAAATDARRFLSRVHDAP